MPTLSIPRAIIVGAVIIGFCIVLGVVATPYRVSSSPAGVWRINTITGDMKLCSIGLPGNRCM